MTVDGRGTLRSGAVARGLWRGTVAGLGIVLSLPPGLWGRTCPHGWRGALRS
jgi:hypothetical protein